MRRLPVTPVAAANPMRRPGSLADVAGGRAGMQSSTDLIFDTGAPQLGARRPFAALARTRGLGCVATPGPAGGAGRPYRRDRARLTPTSPLSRGRAAVGAHTAGRDLRHRGRGRDCRQTAWAIWPPVRGEPDRSRAAGEPAGRGDPVRRLRHAQRRARTGRQGLVLGSCRLADHHLYQPGPLSAKALTRKSMKARTLGWVKRPGG